MKSIIIPILFILSCSPESEIIHQQEFSANSNRFAVMYREIQIDEFLIELSQNLVQNAVLFEHANIITMVDAKILHDQSVYVENGVIKQIGTIDHSQVSNHVLIVDATNKYLMPGLIDMHAHVAEGSHSEKLLFLAAGVTTVREMVGFDWMINLRESIKENSILAPNLYLAGTMLNYTGLGVYAAVVKTEEEARVMVRKQIKKGYDFIKVWNVMPLNLLKAIADECQTLGVDLVGHVPHQATIKDALDLKFKTQEHFKGFILDRFLKLTDEDYVSIINSHSNKYVWYTPTFSLYLQGLKGDTARQFYDDHQIKNYIPKETMQSWIEQSNQPVSGRFGNKPYFVKDLMIEVFNQLKKTNVQYIAGTDFNGENANMVAGYSLIEELKVFESLSMPIFDILKTATINAASALGKADQFGTIEIGKQADLILLDENPLRNLSSLYNKKAVMVRGIWLSKDKTETILTKIQTIYNRDLTKSLANPEQIISTIINHYKRPELIKTMKPITVQSVASALNKIGLKVESIDLMKTLLKHYPSYDSYDILAKIYLANADTITAKTTLKKSLRLNPRGDFAAKFLGERKEK